MSYMSELHQSYHTVRERLYNPPKPNGHAPELVPLHPPAQYNDDRISGLLARIDDLNSRLQKLEEKLADPRITAAAEIPDMAPRISMNSIIKLVCQKEGISSVNLASERRDKYATKARKYVYYLARELTPLSLNGISKFLGMRDHTTILKGAQKIQRQRGNDAALDEHLAWYELTLREQAAKNQRSHQEQVPVAPKDGP